MVGRKCLSPALVHKFMQWKHSGFNLFRGDPVAGTHRAELENLAQYILRHSFSVQKMTYIAHSSRVIYHSRLNPTTRRNFEVFTATDFLAAVTQHIPEKGAQTVKYYGYYSNKARGQRAKAAAGAASANSDSPLPEGCSAPGVEQGWSARSAPESDTPGEPLPAKSAIGHPQSSIPKRVPSRTWRELIRRAWDVDPMMCPKCGGQMRLISLIEDDPTIEKILRHLDLWEGIARRTDRAPPPPLELACVREPFDDDLPFGPDTYAE